MRCVVVGYRVSVCFAMGNEQISTQPSQRRNNQDLIGDVESTIYHHRHHCHHHHRLAVIPFHSIPFHYLAQLREALRRRVAVLAVARCRRLLRSG